MEIVKSVANNGELDHEWVELILEALELGISADEIKEFFSKKSTSTVR